MATKAESDLVIKFMAEQVNVLKTIDQLNTKLDGMAKKLDDGAKRSGNLGKKLSDSLVKVGKFAAKTATLLGTAGFVGAIYKATKAAAQFETKLAEVGTLLGKDAPKQIRQYEKAIRSLARNSSSDVNELTGALYQTISAGVKGTETIAGSMKLVEVSQKAAVAGVSDTQTAVDLLTTILNSYGMTAEEVTKVSDNLFSAVRLGKCIVGSTRVLMADGRYERIDKLQVGGDVVSFDGRAFLPMHARWVDQGKKVAVKLTTRLGRTITTTWNHPYLTKRIADESNPSRIGNHKAEWIKVKDLKLGDRIAVPTAIPFFGTQAVPEHEAALLGLWLAVGSCSASSPRITSNKYGKQIQDWAEFYVCDVENVERREGASPVWEITFGQRGGHIANPVQELLETYGLAGCASETKKLPEAVFTWNRDSVAILLRWLFNGDGWLYDLRQEGRSGFQVGFCSKSEQLVRDVAHLLLRFGIVGRVRSRGNAWVWKINRYSEVNRFVRFIGIDRPAAELVSKHAPEKQRAEWDVIEFDPVVLIEEVGKERVYDLTVEHLHNFVANDIVAHNTTFSEMASQLGQITSIAAGAGVPIEELTSAVAALTKNGLQTDLAVTALGATLARLLDPTKELNEALGGSAAGMLKEKGLVGVMNRINEITKGDSEAIQKLGFDMRAFRGVSVLAGKGIGDFNKALVETQNAAGATEQAYATMSNTFEQKTAKFWNQISDVLIELGQTLLPVMSEWLEKIGKWVSDHKDEIRNFFENVGHAVKATVAVLRDAYNALRDFVNAVGDFFATEQETANYLDQMLGEGAGDAIRRRARRRSAQGPQVGTFGGEYATGIDPFASGGGGGGTGLGTGITGAAITGAGAGGAITQTGKVATQVDKEWRKKHERTLKALHALRMANAGELQRLQMKHAQQIADAMKMTFANRKEREEFMGLLREKQAAEIDAFEKKKLEERRDIEKKQFEEEQRRIDQLHEHRMRREKELRSAIKRMTSGTIGAWSGRIGGMEGESAEARRDRFQFRDSPPGFWDLTFWENVAQGFAERLGARLLDVAVSLGEGMFKPFEQITGLVGAAMGGSGLADVQQMADQAVQMWETLAQNAGPILQWIAEEGIPKILDAFIENLPIIIDALVEWIPVIIQRIVERIPEIINVVINKLPEIISAIIGMVPMIVLEFIKGVPLIVYEFIKNIPRLAMEIGKAIAKVFLDIVTLGAAGKKGGGGGTTEEQRTAISNAQQFRMRFHRGGVVPDVAAPTFHQGGMINRNWRQREWTAADFVKALRAHGGMFVRPRLGPDEVPIIAQAGEAILNRGAVDRLGGGPAVDAINAGRGAGNVTINNTVKTEYLYSEDASTAVDRMVARMVRDNIGYLRGLVGDKVAGFSPRRK